MRAYLTKAVDTIARAFGVTTVVERASARSFGGRVLADQALWFQFQRIGGAMTPARVSQILRQRDSGDMTAYVDLLNESRQKDGHLHGILSQAEESIAELDWTLKLPEKARARDKRAMRWVENALRQCTGDNDSEAGGFADRIALQHSVELHTGQGELKGAIDAGQHRSQPIVTGDAVEDVRFQTIDADIQIGQSGGGPVIDVPGQVPPVSGHGDLADIGKRAEAADNVAKVATDSGLAARQPEFGHSATAEDPAQALNLQRGHHGGAGDLLIAIGQAIDATEVAHLGERNAQVAESTAKAVGEGFHVSPFPSTGDEAVSSLTLAAMSGSAGRPWPRGFRATRSERCDGR